MNPRPPEPHAPDEGTESRHPVVLMRCSEHRCYNSDPEDRPGIAAESQQNSQHTDTRRGLCQSSRPRHVKEASITSQTADCVCLKRPPPARVPCPRATPGLPLATLQASGRVAPVPKRFAVTHASVVQESISPPIVGTAQTLIESAPPRRESTASSVRDVQIAARCRDRAPTRYSNHLAKGLLTRG